MAVLRQFAVPGFGEPKVPFDDQERVPQGGNGIKRDALPIAQRISMG